jgi:hypothetical protein
VSRGAVLPEHRDSAANLDPVDVCAEKIGSKMHARRAVDITECDYIRGVVYKGP